MNIDLAQLDNQEFEDLCNNLLRREFGAVTSIDGSGGDKGVDGFKGEINGEVVVYQHKFYLERLAEAGRKQKIINSFETAQEHHPGMEKWVLMIARDLTIGEQEWFEEEIKQPTPNIETKYWNKTEIEDRLTKHKTLVQRFFPNSMMSLGQRHDELINYLDKSVVEKTEMLYQRLEGMKKEFPDLGIEYEISSKQGVKKLSLNPEFDVNINTDLKIDQKKAEQIQEGEKVRFTKDEIVDIEFNPDLLPDEEIEPDELVVKPWYSDWEEEVQIEVPGGGFRKELTIGIEDISKQVVTIATEDTVFDINLKYDPTTEETEFELTPEFDGQPVHKIAEVLDFVETLKSNERLLIRKLEDGKSVLSGELTEGELIEETEWLRDVISDLELIEAHTGTSFTLDTEIDEEEDWNILVAKELLTDGESSCPYTVTGDCPEGTREDLLDLYTTEDTGIMKVKMKDFYVTVQGQEIQIGDVVCRYPDPELTNMDKIRDKIGQSDPTPFKICPSEDATIEVV